MVILAVLGVQRVYGIPGTPGVPQAPTVVYEEDFANRAADSNILLTGYTGLSGMTYSADPYWLDRDNCNGFIVNYDSPYNAGDCDAAFPAFGSVLYNNMLTLTYALGVHNNAADPEAFPVVSAYSEGDGVDDLIQFQTDSKIPMPSGSNFISFSVDVSAVNCASVVQPLLRFYLVDENNITAPVSAAPINPCTDSGSTDVTVPNPNGGTVQARVGTFVAGGAILFDGSELGIVMRNEEGLGLIGNDSAYTNIRVLNVNPQLDKEFAAPADEYNPGDNIPVTFTITNTTDLAAKSGWSFSDNLPAGLVIADNPAIVNTCSGGSVTAVAKASSLTVTGNLNDGQAFCRITLNLSATTTGTFTNGPGNLTVTGLLPPANATVTVTQGSQLADTGMGVGLFATIGTTLTISSAVGLWLRRKSHLKFILR